MRPIARRHGFSFDWAAVIVPLLGLVAAWSMLTQSLPNTDDGALHMLRLVQLDRCLQHGTFCLRWAPDFAHGYGYPGFNYYMNLPTIYAEGLHLLGLDFPQAMAGGFLTALLLSGWGAYLLGRDLVGRTAGLVVATAYMYAPYQFLDSSFRGNLPESWALALVPWVLWTARRAALSRRWRSIVPFAVVYGALLFTHNIYAAITSPVVGAYLALLWWQGGRSLRDVGRLSAMVGLGLALGAFFWMPAFFERGWTRYSPGLFDYEATFLPLRELLTLPQQYDISTLNPDIPRSLSWATLLLAAASVVAWMFRKSNGRARVAAYTAPNSEGAFFGLALVMTAALTLPVAAPLYRTVKPLQLIQMPWRYLGLASLAGSVCAGWAIAYLPQPDRWWTPRLAAACSAIVLLVVAAIPWTYAAPFPQPQDAGVDEIIRWEYATGLVGGTSAQEFLPVWSAGVPEEPADSALLKEQDPLIARLDDSSLPEGAQVLSADYGIMDARLRIKTPVAFRALYKQFYFPGWQVAVDGRAVSPVIVPPYGLLGFEVPAGTHEVTVRPGTTPMRTAGTAISAAGLLCAVGLLFLDRAAPAARRRRPVRARAALVFGTLAVSILLAKEGWVDRTENLFRGRHFDGTAIQDVENQAQVNFGDALTLLGYELGPQPVVAGRPLRVDLYLSARRAVQGDYMAYARLVDDEGRLWSLADNGRPDGYRPPPSTEIWPGDAYGHWAYLSYTLPGTPPGNYWVEIAVFERETWRGLNVLDGEGRVTGVTKRIGPVEVVAPRRPPAIAALEFDRAIERQATPALRCLGTTQSRRTAQAGDALDITVFWQATAPPTDDYTLSIALALADGTTTLSNNLPLGRREYPTSRWEAGEIVRSPHRLRIPATIAGGAYAIEGTLLDGGEQPASAPLELGTISIMPTERIFALPAGITGRPAAVLEGLASLAGYDLVQADVQPGGALEVTLYWQALREMETSYKAFLQVVGPDGVLVQVDAVPDGWQRPTTGWVAGEVIADPYVLAIPEDAPAGNYTVIAGLYEEATMQRLRVLDDQGRMVADHVALQEITVH
ncbi:MAG: 6-pyruvoyl-tetrahydropterin synthase-related protein [Anaerolineae bacterium]